MEKSVMPSDSPYNETPPIIDRESYQQWYDANSHFSNRDMSIHMDRLFWLLPLARGHVLEVGCQWGGVTEHLLGNSNVSLVDCIDITDEHIQKTTEHIISLPFAFRSKIGGIDKAYIEDDVMPKEEYDTVVLFEVLEHVLDPLAVLRSCKRCLRGPSSRVLISVPNGDCFPEPDHLRSYTEKSLIRDIEGAFIGCIPYTWQVITTAMRPSTNYSWILACVELGDIHRGRHK
jgi:2-polyprenyl-3-methyl-5-hydroxy-6-metoxy-1,4-benzoquinol methylase